MPIHYEQLDGHVARITIDRPKARNSLDLYHFRDLAEAWRRFRDADDDWVAIVTGVDGNFMTGATPPPDRGSGTGRGCCAPRGGRS